MQENIIFILTPRYTGLNRINWNHSVLVELILLFHFYIRIIA